MNRRRIAAEKSSAKLNMAGTSTSVRIVATVSPNSTATAIGAHQALDSAPATIFGGHWWISRL